MDPRDLAEIKSLAHKMGGKYVGIKGGRHTFDFPRDSAEDAKELADSLHDLGFEAYVDNGDVKIKESKVSAATKLIEFVKRGMNAQQAIDKVLAKPLKEARTTMMNVDKVADKAAKAFMKKHGMQPRGEGSSWGHIDRDKLQDFLMDFDAGIDADDQEVADAFFEEAEGALEGMGYQVR